MAEIPRRLLSDLTDELNALSEEGQRMVLNVLENAEWSDVAELREIAIEAMEQVCSVMTDMAAARTAEFYDAVRTASVGSALGAEPLSGRVPEATEGAVRAGIQSVVETGATAQFGRFLTARIDYETKRASGECIYRNGVRDPLKPRFARVPSGSETCPFCIMLASRGFVYHDAKKAGEDGHYHPNCDCRIVPGFDHYYSGPSRRRSASTEVEGYDMDDLYDRYVEDLRSGKLNPSSVYRNTSHVQNWKSDKFDSYGDFAQFVKGAETIEELQERCAYVTTEWEKTGLGDKYWNQLKTVVIARRKELVEIARKLAEP